jgi:hypothetical protein
MRLTRVAWLVLLAAFIIVVAVPALQDQARAIPVSLVRRAWPLDEYVWMPWALPQAAAFGARHQPDDPEMLLGLATLALTAESNASSCDAGESGEPQIEEAHRTLPRVLRRVTAAQATPAAWAAYTEALLFRPKPAPPDLPANIPSVPATPRDLSALHASDRWRHSQSLDAQAPVLNALCAWRAADAENALPVAWEALTRYAVGEDAQALSLWHAASKMPLVSDRWNEREAALILLLRRMGFPEMEAEAAGVWATDSNLRMLLLMLVADGEMTYDEGIRALSQGRPEKAVRLWQATMDLGRRLQESADDVGEFQMGVSLERLGAEPVWRVHPRQTPGMPEEARSEQRFWYGTEHAVYVSQMGEEADAALRDRLVANEARFDLFRGPFAPLGNPWFHAQDAATDDLHAFIFLALAVGVLVLLFCAASIVERQAADNATTIGLGWRAFLILAPLLAGYLVILAGPGPPLWPENPAHSLWWSAVAVPVTALFVSLLPAIYRRRDSASVWAAWRGSIRIAFPGIAALLAVGCVAVGFRGATLRTKVTSELRRSDLVVAVEQLGDKWQHPPIRHDAWRAAYPPKPPSESTHSRSHGTRTR